MLGGLMIRGDGCRVTEGSVRMSCMLVQEGGKR